MSDEAYTECVERKERRQPHDHGTRLRDSREVPECAVGQRRRVRDLFFGRSRYGEFLTAGESIPTNVLAERLRRLQAGGLVEKTGARPRGTYHLTPTGRALGPIL